MYHGFDKTWFCNSILIAACNLRSHRNYIEDILFPPHYCFLYLAFACLGEDRELHPAQTGGRKQAQLRLGGCADPKFLQSGVYLRAVLELLISACAYSSSLWT